MGVRRFGPKPSALLISGAYGLVLAFIGGILWKSERSGAFPSLFFPWQHFSTFWLSAKARHALKAETT
jgi:hypothetical protein